MRPRVIFTRIAVAQLVALFSVGTLHAQEPPAGMTLAIAFVTEYPDRFQEGCGNPVALAPSVRAHHRIYRRLSAELGVSATFQMPPGVYSSCGDAVPLVDGDIRRYFDPPRGSMSLAGEARLVLSPALRTDNALRLIGGGAWYPARSSPAWILGAGYRSGLSRGSLVVDVEWWNVGVAYDLEQYRVGLPREFLGSGREWQGFWQIRVGVNIWSS